MLIDAPFKSGDTVSLKLNSGEEVVARLEEDADSILKVSKPLMLTATQDGVGLAPFMFTVGTDQPIALNKNSILCVVKTEENMASQYIQNTTGLTMS